MDSEYKMTIGLEIHAELKTKSKMFCGCKNDPDEEFPNVNVCPVCMGHPGPLPVVNKEAVRKVLLVGSAVEADLADFTEFDRKNYFYPDIPKGYQISQYKYPLVSGGKINGINLTRIHLEEDTASSTHDTPGVSLVNFNRAGVPLMELVTDPEIHSVKEAIDFAKELQLILQYLEVSEANMEKGEMRVEVNISVSKGSELGIKVEVKNINSFKAAGKSIDFEFNRQVTLLEKGEGIVQETRGWDENKEITFSQRSKENAKDYRYFPDPDLPKLVISEIPEFSLENLKKELPKLPEEKREEYKKWGIKNEDIDFYINDPLFREFFDRALESGLDNGSVVLASNYLVSDLSGLSKNSENGLLGKVTQDNFIKLIKMIKAGDLSSRGAKDTLKIMFEAGGEPETIAKEKGLIQKNDPEEIKNLARRIIDENPDSVVEYKNGKESLLQFFVGQGMKLSKGSINPELLKSVILEILK
ncbi:MAG TPA: Asp-tRNA(Asn)/Glu-tRNA(Gln) amidotransferase subunit GatB [Candidatus Paceibacterota bacterium]